VNWSAEADAGIMEAVYMDQLGLEIPGLLRTAVLMAPQLRLDKEAISTLLAHYYQVYNVCMKAVMSVYNDYK